MSDIEEGDLVLSTGYLPRTMIGMVLVAKHAHWGMWYNLLWEDGTVTPHWNRFGCTPEIIKYETENTIRVSGFTGLLQRPG